MAADASKCRTASTNLNGLAFRPRMSSPCGKPRQSPAAARNGLGLLFSMQFNQHGLIYGGGLATIYFVSRVWAKFKMDAATRRKQNIPLFDAVLLEIATTPPKDSAEDPDVLAEIRETLAHLNCQSYAEEFWGLDKQLVEYYSRLPVSSRPTMRAALIRLLRSEDRWLEVVGARSCANLSLREAAPLLRQRIAGIQSAGDAVSYADRRLLEELAEAQAKLDRLPGASKSSV